MEQRIFETIADETDMTDIDNIIGFDVYIGGTVKGGWINFGSASKKIESRQILSAYRTLLIC